ncbi:hypothetical protein GO496_19175 [Acidovorax citrulli]|nr:hypothetical protein [Paracidovorax citrulli]
MDDMASPRFAPRAGLRSLIAIAALAAPLQHLRCADADRRGRHPRQRQRDR